ncbi:MAG TPA: transglycosylase SLT domain-containing protein [Egibacteraceae bacterium]|nr:transglycosylase SLT domain-containing protein [Egibacteraceae bacterium]
MSRARPGALAGGFVAVVLAVSVPATDRATTGGHTLGDLTSGTTSADAAAAREPAPRPRLDRARPDRTAVLPSTHTVAPGDTLHRVAERYAVSAGSLARANAVTMVDPLRPGQRLVIPGDDPLELTTPEDVAAARLAVEHLLTDAAMTFGLDVALVQGLAWVESRWMQRVVSSQGAIGIMQVRPRTGETMAHQLGRPLDLHDVGDNVTAGAAYLAVLLDRHHGDLRAALAAYHQGPASVRRRGWLPVTRRYVADVLAAQERFTQARAER